MKPAVPIALVISAFIAAPALAAECETQTQAKAEAALTKSSLEAGLTDGISALLATPRAFEDTSLGAQCTQPKLNHPLYPGVPVKECTYQRAGLTGWVMVANPYAPQIAKWIANACGETADAKTCAMRLTAQAWCTSQFVYPVVGNMITADGVNTVFLHGVAIERPSWLPEKTSVSVDTQKQRLSPLALSETAYGGRAASIAWPIGATSDTYLKYAKPPEGAAKVGAVCATLTRRPEWIRAARASYRQAWGYGRYPLFDAAAKALVAGEVVSGKSCG